MYELIGYAASVLVAVSLMMTSILRLRIINLIGAALFAIYGLVIGAVPVAAVNSFIVAINIFYLVRIFRTREYFKLLEVRADSEYLRHFLTLNRADIERYQPDFRLPHESRLIFFVLRDVVPAGLFIGELRDDGCMLVQLDYALPGYRDFKSGEFVFRQHTSFFQAHGIERIVARASTRTHARYLQRMGFTPRRADNVFVLDLS